MEAKLSLENNKIVLVVKEAGRITKYENYSMPAMLEIVKELFNYKGN